MTEGNNEVTDPIVISLEAVFHGIRETTWCSKLIQFPKGGILWGLHLSKQQTAEGDTSRIIGCLVCFGPLKEHSENWSISFDHVFTISSKRVGCPGSIRKGCHFSGTHHIINNYEWGDHRMPLPENWGTHDNVKLSCHMYISQTNGLDRNVLKEAASQDQIEENVECTLTASQIETQVMKCFSDLLLNESIVYTEDGYEAVEKLSELFSYPNILDICRRHLMKLQNVKSEMLSDNDGEQTKHTEMNLTGFDYHENSSNRRQRMESLTENDIVAIFQHLCSIAFKKCIHNRQ